MLNAGDSRGGGVKGNRHEESQNHCLRPFRLVNSPLRPHLKQVTLERGSQLKDSGERIQYVYFSLSGMVSLLSVMSDGRAVKPAVVGREGPVGVQSGLGNRECIFAGDRRGSGCGVAGTGKQFYRLARDGEKLRDLLFRLSRICFAQMQQSLAVQRVARGGRTSRALVVAFQRHSGARRGAADSGVFLLMCWASAA